MCRRPVGSDAAEEDVTALAMAADVVKSKTRTSWSPAQEKRVLDEVGENLTLKMLARWFVWMLWRRSGGQSAVGQPR